MTLVSEETPPPLQKKNPPKRGLDSNSIDIFLYRVSQNRCLITYTRKTRTVIAPK